MSATGNLRVLKFGGSSLATADRLARVLRLVARERNAGPLALVISAVGESTDLLLEAAAHAAARRVEAAEGTAATFEANLRAVHRLDGAAAGPFPEDLSVELSALRRVLGEIALAGRAPPAALDEVMSFGERTAARLVAALLVRSGQDAVYVDARRWTTTDDRFGSAAVDLTASRRKLQALWPGVATRLSVHTGFLGATPDGRTTTIGRNGSDYTAALLANFLGAAELVRWTDVSGIMTADPRLVPEAYPVSRLSYDEALELASLGQRVLHPRTLQPLVEAGIPLRIRNSLDPDAPGTRVDVGGNPDENRPTCVTSLEGLALLAIEWRQGRELEHGSERVLRALDAAGVAVYLAVQQPRGRALSLAIPAASLEGAKAALAAELAAERAAGTVDELTVRLPVTLVTLVAEAMGRTANVAGRFFSALGSIGVSVRAAGQGAAARSISSVIDAGATPAALRAVHAAFNLAHEELNLLVLGKGTVGGALLGHLEAQGGRLRREERVELRVAGLADTRRLIFEEGGLPVSTLRTRLAEEAPQELTLARLVPVLDRLARLPVPVLIDCTAASGMELLYAEAFQRGIHVVAANKKPLALPQPQRDLLLEVARRHHRAYLYETTVGASLPIIETLKNLVRTGDRVRLIEGSLSGTLGYLCGKLMEGIPLAEAVSDARQRGFTEPHPADDLSGLDAARKALILARELGLRLDLEDVKVEPFVPAELLGERDPDRFFEALRAYGPTLEQQLGRVRAEGRVLRYLARIEVTESLARVSVGPTFVPAGHPATRQRGSEAFVAFATERYADYPLAVQGAGAGGAVTAAGVLADVLRIAQTLRGR